MIDQLRKSYITIPKCQMGKILTKEMQSCGHVVPHLNLYWSLSSLNSLPLDSLSYMSPTCGQTKPLSLSLGAAKSAAQQHGVKKAYLHWLSAGLGEQAGGIQSSSASFVCACVHVLSGFSCVQLLATLMDYSPPGPSVHGILQAEHWSGLLCSIPGNLPHPGREPACISYVSCIGRQVLYH